VAGCSDKELMAWDFRSLTGCLREYQRNTEAVCALIVQDDAAVLAKVATDADFDTDTLGVCSAMIYATSRMLLRELETEGDVLGRITIGTDYNLLVIEITPKFALATLYKNWFSTGLLEHQARAIMPRMIDCLVREGTEVS
jgi:predicted regulator of Ras-like GTPase activity (Roadblock/LC7/MglB family)